MNDYLNVIRNNYANFQGRARRREFWMFSLINFIILTVLEIPVLVSLPALSASTDGNGQTSSPLMWLMIISGLLILLYSLFILLPSLAVSVRRLHDTGKSGWWYLISFVPFIGSLAVLVLMVLDSEPGSNPWGPNPKGETAAVTANSW
ncbi:DUF805 domain-containing protein [Deinococcus sp. KSM4-11]|uniref:DUF805 domain-containing protein n=1 Tax=Deinococcus sp. KSM4-11 TaxID=2568654 RepID=UPI0010A4B6C4|nr:DUF805 domain-containing protein [Deinococcus sp. KSM4-11]THF84883.1 DUF805 domain-containing protein [Deinococcus sp. KSM4-11]